MALRKQVVAVPLSGGLDQKTDDKWVVPGRLTLAENVRYRKDGRISLRDGYAELSDLPLGSATPIGTGDALGLFEGELLKFKGPDFYGWSPGAGRWIDKGAMPPLVVSGKAVAAATAAQSMPHAASVGGQTLYAWEDGRGGVRASVVDDASGAYVVADTEINASAVTPKAAAFGTRIVVLYRVAGELRSRVYVPATGTLEAEQTVVTDAHASACHIDLAARGTDAVVVAYRTSTPEIAVAYLLETGLFAGVGSIYPSAVTVAEDPANCLGAVYCPDEDQVWLGWHHGTNGLRGAVLNGDLTSKLSPTTVDSDTATKRNITGGLVTSAQIRWWYEHAAANSYDQRVETNTLTDAGAAGTAAVFKRSVGLAAKAFAQSSATCAAADYVPLVHDSTLQATYFLANTDGAIVGKMRALQAGGLTAKPGLADVLSSVGDVYRFPALSKRKLVSEGGDVFTLSGVWEVSLDFRAPPQHYSAQLGDNLHVAGGVLYAYDGLGAVEHGFHLFPENVSAATASTGGSMSDGTYRFKVVYEWTDNRGQVHRSAPGPAGGLEVVLSAGTSTQKVTLTIPTLRLTAKTDPRSEVSVAVYGTEDAGSVYYRLSSITAPLYNDPDADSVSFERTAADSAIIANEQIYTTGTPAPLEHIGPPTSALIAASKTRVFLGGLEDGNRIVYSKEHVRGDGVGFSDLLELRLPPDGGRETALALLDERLVVFKRDAIYYVAGKGPANTGKDNDFSRPLPVQSDVGCIEPASLVEVPDGLMFQSAKGIYLLTRNLQVRYIGAPVEDHNALTVTSADVLDDANEAVFLTDEGPALVYNYFWQRWSTWANHAGKDAIVWGGTYHYLTPQGPVWAQTPGLHADNGTAIRMKGRTSWLYLGELQGFQRVYRVMLLGTYRSDHQLVVRAGYDFQSWFDAGRTYDVAALLDSSLWGGDTVWGEAGTVWGGVEDNVWQFEYPPARQKCQALRLEFEIHPADDAGEGCDIAALSVLAGVKRGLGRINTDKRAG